jgi:hypothetical protein
MLGDNGSIKDELQAVLAGILAKSSDASDEDTTNRSKANQGSRSKEDMEIDALGPKDSDADNDNGSNASNDSKTQRSNADMETENDESKDSVDNEGSTASTNLEESKDINSTTATLNDRDTTHTINPITVY